MQPFAYIIAAIVINIFKKELMHINKPNTLHILFDILDRIGMDS